jgi:hypothetical protein
MTGDDRIGDFMADGDLPGGNHDLGAVLREALDDGAPNTPRGAGDDGHFAVKVEERHAMFLPRRLIVTAFRT